MIILPSLEIVPAKYDGSTLLSQIPIDGTGDFTVTRATTPTADRSTRVNALGFIETVANNLPRLDYPIGGGCPALLVEPAATNGIRNNSMVGAVAGSPGTMPTNWGTALSGLTRTVVGTGTENGVAYLDIRFNGTATGTAIAIAYDANTIIAALQNQVWTHSVYARFTANVLNMPSLRVGMYEFNSGGTYLTEGFGSGVTLTSNLTRLSFTRTLTNASTAFVGAILQMPIVNGTSYDFTIRIGYPQMEQSSVATSVIPTTTAAITRGADVITDTTATALIGQTEGTIYFEAQCTTPSDFSDIIRIEGAGSNNINIIQTASNAYRMDLQASGVTRTIISTTTGVTGFAKIAIAYKTNELAISVNGGAPTTAALSFTFNGALTTIRIAHANYTALRPYRLRAAALYTTSLTDTQLALLTSPYTSYSSMASALSYTLG